MIPVLKLSQHATLRMAQRNISLGDLEYVLKYGERVYKTGITIYVLRKRDILPNDRKDAEITRLEGTVVLTGFTQDGNLDIITIYRNKGAFRTLQCKEKYDNRKNYRTGRKFSERE